MDFFSAAPLTRVISNSGGFGFVVKGNVVTDVFPGTPASHVMQVGDTIIAVDDHKINNPSWATGNPFVPVGALSLDQTQAEIRNRCLKASSEGEAVEFTIHRRVGTIAFSQRHHRFPANIAQLKVKVKPAPQYEAVIPEPLDAPTTLTRTQRRNRRRHANREAAFFATHQIGGPSDFFVHQEFKAYGAELHRRKVLDHAKRQLVQATAFSKHHATPHMGRAGGRTVLFY